MPARFGLQFPGLLLNQADRPCARELPKFRPRPTPLHNSSECHPAKCRNGKQQQRLDVAARPRRGLHVKSVRVRLVPLDWPEPPAPRSPSERSSDATLCPRRDRSSPWRRDRAPSKDRLGVVLPQSRRRLTREAAWFRRLIRLGRSGGNKLRSRPLRLTPRRMPSKPWLLILEMLPWHVCLNFPLTHGVTRAALPALVLQSPPFGAPPRATLPDNALGGERPGCEALIHSSPNEPPAQRKAVAGRRHRQEKPSIL